MYGDGAAYNIHRSRCVGPFCPPSFHNVLRERVGRRGWGEGRGGEGERRRTG